MTTNEDATFTTQIEQRDDNGQVLGYLRMDFAGEVRRCQPYHPDNTCPSCETNRTPRFTLGRFTVGRKPHPVTVEDETFVLRDCGNCGFTWRELNPAAATGSK